MLQRIYINNFRCMVNFELTIEDINLFLGANGAGKTTVFEVLLKLQELIAEGKMVNELFDASDLTRWQDSSIQNFELEIAGNDGIYKYALSIEYEQKQGSTCIKNEILKFNNRTLFEFDAKTGKVQLYNDDHKKGPEYLFDWSRSAISLLQESPENKKIIWFKKRLSKFFIVHINPAAMTPESRKDEKKIAWDMSNFSAWFRYLSQDQENIIELTNELRKIIPDFSAFKIDEAGEAKILKVGFKNSNISKKVIHYKFDELSEGQRAIIALYTLMICSPGEEFTLCIDEPENFLALPEIQPWLDFLYEYSEEHSTQVIMISHHPSLINYLAASAGTWFSRQDSGPVRVQSIESEDKAHDHFIKKYFESIGVDRRKIKTLSYPI
ncbi:MAG: AAA family ATPase [bacterium]|nr:AAA family ATPase [bacterium]